ncbi:DUF6241 domain-containing protein [Planococcus maritimus]|uniref:DUF6241 domain-containing protein n=1 Tax=Planococcus maritimus TaxID=192421 RepID=UPI000798BD7C|nr:DUF6241 domain-containing protein [Planococcus maritimus]KYG59401.1 hypothetical protein AY633_03920 [Planococcus maritimus]
MSEFAKTMMLSVVLIGLIGAAGYYVLLPLFSADANIALAAKKANGQRPEEGQAIGMSEPQFQKRLHQMTHQKVVADEKRGVVEMTPETIENMLLIVTANQDVYDRAFFYELELNAWQESDFSNASEFHNVIWKLQNGVDGEATGLMTEEQEARFVEKHFR